MISRNLPPRHAYRDDDPSDTGSNRAFGCTVGGILMGIGGLKALLAGAASVAASAMFGVGALLVLLGIAVPTRLARVHRLWLRLGEALAAVANPVVMAVLFAAVVTPTALAMRLLGKRPLRLTSDPAAGSYWIAREAPDGEQSSMRRQF